jgi:hypothetical protein
LQSALHGRGCCHSFCFLASGKSSSITGQIIQIDRAPVP